MLATESTVQLIQTWPAKYQYTRAFQTSSTIIDVAYKSEHIFMVSLDPNAGTEDWQERWPFEISKFKIGQFYEEISESYRIQIYETSGDYDQHLGARIDTVNQVDGDGTEADAWFMCVS